jgi:hypothetical protein
VELVVAADVESATSEVLIEESQRNRTPRVCESSLGLCQLLSEK